MGHECHRFPLWLVTTARNFSTHGNLRQRGSPIARKLHRSTYRFGPSSRCQHAAYRMPDLDRDSGRSNRCRLLIRKKIREFAQQQSSTWQREELTTRSRMEIEDYCLILGDRTAVGLANMLRVRLLFYDSLHQISRPIDVDATTNRQCVRKQLKRHNLEDS